MRRAALVFNPAAGSASDDLDELRRHLGRHFSLELVTTSAECDADACARAALTRAPDVVIAAGGDGTVSMVAGELVGTTTALGILARGTSNSIATALGVPTDTEGALETLTTGDVTTIDTARANGRPMLLHASIGLHADTVARTTADAKSRWGVLAYVKEGLVNLADLQTFAVEIETDHEIVRCQAVNVTAANVAPPKTVLAQGPAVLSPIDGRLDVTIVAGANLADLVLTGLHLLTTASQSEPATRDNVGFFSATRIRVDSDPPQQILVDGEPAGEGRLVVESVPQSLRVIVPREQRLPSGSGDRKLEGLPELEIARRR